MRKIVITLLLAIAVIPSLPAAVTRDGEEAYELCRTAISLLAYRDMERGNDRTKGEVFLNTLVSMKPEWEPSRFDDFLDLIHESGAMDDDRLYVIKYSDSRTRPALLAFSGRIYSASDSDTSYEWYEFRVEDYEVTYSKDNEIKEYKIDGLIDIKAYLIDSTIVIGVDAYDLEAGRYDIGDSSFKLVSDINSDDFSATYNGRILGSDDAMAIARLVEIAAYYLDLI